MSKYSLGVRWSINGDMPLQKIYSVSLETLKQIIAKALYRKVSQNSSGKLIKSCVSANLRTVSVMGKRPLKKSFFSEAVYFRDSSCGIKWLTERWSFVDRFGWHNTEEVNTHVGIHLQLHCTRISWECYVTLDCVPLAVVASEIKMKRDTIKSCILF